jgi:small subunit ribosomal protein S6
MATAITDKLNTYEGMFLLGPAGQTSGDNGVGLVRGIIERHGGQIIHIKRWDERKLTYEIKRQKRGTYVIAFFRAPGGAVSPIERDVKLSDDLLRVLITDASHLNETEMAAVEPQPIIREERPSFDRPWESRGGDRGDRGDRGGDRGDRSHGGDRGADRGPRPPRRAPEDHPAPPAPSGGAGNGADKD